MRKISTYAVIIMTVIMTSCGASKTVMTSDVEVLTPCQGSEYLTDTENFRSSAVGISKSQEVANQKAMTYARSKLATSIEATVKTVTESYISSYDDDDMEKSIGRYQTITREVVNQKLSGVRVICNQTMQSQDGKYKCYVAVEVSSSEIVAAIGEKIDADSKLKTDFEYQKYLKVYNEEMSNFATEEE